MLELYHSINSVCAQKVRIALAEKRLSYREHLMRLGGDQFDPAYMKLNPNAVVPTLIHDGQAVIESSVILYYLDEAFPEKPLMPAAPLARVKVRLFNKLIDEYVHNSCTILTFATAFRPGLLKLSPAEREAGFAKSPSKKRSEYKRDVVAHGLDSGFVKEAVEHHEKLLTSRSRMQFMPRRTSRAMPTRSRTSRSYLTSCGWSCWGFPECGMDVLASRLGGSASAGGRRRRRRSSSA